MYLEKTEVTTVAENIDKEVEQTLFTTLADSELLLVGGGMGDVLQ